MLIKFQKGNVYGKVLKDRYPESPRTFAENTTSVLGVSSRTFYLTDTYASEHYLLDEVRESPKYSPSWENEDSRHFKNLSDIETLLEVAVGCGFLVRWMHIDHPSDVGKEGDIPNMWGNYFVFYLSPKTIHKEWGKGPAAYKMARKCMQIEMEELAAYLEGECYGIEIGNCCKEGCCCSCCASNVDTCWGHYRLADAEAAMIDEVNARASKE